MGLGLMLLKLLLALIAGGVVGFERERQERPAGLRTHMFVCAGSALITLISLNISPGIDTRIAAQIVTGIGFLGAGTIFRAGNSIRGLTTAAGLWAVAGIGMGIAVGGSLQAVALFMAAVVFLINRWVRLVEQRYLRNYHEIIVRFQPGQDVLPCILRELSERDIAIQRMRWLSEKAQAGESAVKLQLRLSRPDQAMKLQAWLGAYPGVVEVSVE